MSGCLPFRLATFNVETLDDRADRLPRLEDRIAVIRPRLVRLRADILCLQEVDGQSDGSGQRKLMALDALLQGTPYADFHRVSTFSQSRGGARDKHNLVILSRFPVLEFGQIRHDLVSSPLYRQCTAEPQQPEGREIEWDRPFLHATLDVGRGRVLHVVNVHLRAPRAAYVEGQKADARKWLSAQGWAEGFFLAAVKRAGQALEVRLFVDQLLDENPESMIVVTGDFNAEDHETPVRTIRGDEEDMGSGHLAPRILVALERSLSDSQRYSVIHGGHPRMLDHILASQALLSWYRTVEVHNEGLGDELSSPAVIEGSPDSYHAPVVAAFELDE